MQRWRHALRRCSSRSWWTAAGLALLTLLISLLIDERFYTALELRNLPWSVLPVMAGVALLNTRQESLLVVLFLILEISCNIAHRIDHANGLIAELLWAHRSFILLGCIWAAHVRTQLENQHQKLQASQAALGEKLAQSLKASALAHELRQPLSQLLLQTRLLQHRFQKAAINNPPLKQAMAELQTCGSQINDLIEAIGSLLRESATPMQSVDLTALLRVCLQQLRPKLQASGVTLQLQLPQRPVLVNGVPGQLEIACWNLLSNACEALEGQPQPSHLACSLQAEAGIVELVVADSGPGLASSNLRDLLMRSTKPQGMGVGLLTVQSIACHHGGALHLGQSNSVGGAEVRLSLPLSTPRPT